MDSVTQIGLDVHKETIAVALLRPGEARPDERVIANTSEALRKLVAGLGDPSRYAACYEAGPTGYDTQRLLVTLGVSCDVIAPSLIPRRAGRRVKTDRLDARNLARLHRAGELTAIMIPSAEEEALRDLVRVREDLKADRRRAVQRLKSSLLRQGRRFPGSDRGWTAAYDRWVRTQMFPEPAAGAAFDHCLMALSQRTQQLEAIDRQIEEAGLRPPLAEPVARLRCFRGIDTLSAVTIAAEVCDFRRFPSASSFMAFTGLVPSEHSSGASRRQGSITKTGNAHVRRVLVEAAWSYRHRPAVGVTLRRRSQDQPPEVLAYCWAAQVRLHGRFARLGATKNKNVAVAAVARELAGFVWGLMTERIEL
jgi:transposase